MIASPLHACTRCGAARYLLAALSKAELLCRECWRALGEPWPKGETKFYGKGAA